MRINTIYNTYKSEIDFYCVYVKEAHPEDNIGGYQTKPNTDEGIIFNQHTNLDERAEVAQVCMMRMNLEMPMVLDDMDDTAEIAYAAYPDRLYLVEADGRISYRSELGPDGFIVDDWEDAIKALVARNVAA